MEGEGVKEDKEYVILTNEISKATFGKNVDEYKELKGLKKDNIGIIWMIWS